MFKQSDGITYRKKEVRDVHRDVDRNAHVGEMEAIAQPDERKRDYMMENELFEVLSRLLEHQYQHDGLLRPIARLQQVVGLE